MRLLLQAAFAGIVRLAGVSLTMDCRNAIGDVAV
jgi:hypothetical protein